MTRVVLGPTGGQRRRWTLIAPFFIVALVALMLTAGAQAVHDDGVFELDRNAVNEAAPGEDWNLVCPASTPQGTAPGCLGGSTAQTKAFVTDDNRIYTGGSTKDDLDTTGWRHTVGSVPDKDELLHGYAARYGDLLYFGADRLANNGDAQIGVWFFQGAVGPLPDGTFSGAHQDGDTLILSDFTKGGETSTIRVFKWNGPGGSIPGQGAIDGTLDLIFGTTASPQDCVGPPPLAAGDPACATVNRDSTPSPWAFTPKSGPANSFAKGEFYEGGIDLGALNLGGECFSSVILETRSSQSVDAVLKDFVAASFEHCGANITIAPNAVNEVNATHTFTVTITKTVSGTTTGVSGVKPTVTLTASGGAILTNVNKTNCETTGTNGSGVCTVTFSSSHDGTVTGHAEADVPIGTPPTNFHVATGAGSTTGGPDAVKQFVDANVSITPNATNEVGTAHTFTISTTAFKAGATTGTMSITPSLAAPAGFVLNTDYTTSNTCASPSGSPADTRTCTLTVNSTKPGKFTANATVTWNFSLTGGSPSSAIVTRDTDPATLTIGSGPSGSGPATKNYVDAKITIAPSGVNEVGHAHTFQVTVTALPGDTGLTASAMSVTTSVTPSGATISGTCNTLSPASGNTRSCTLVVNSTSAGTFTANATGSITIGGVTMSRSTDGTHGSSGAATKDFVDANILISPQTATNEVNNSHTFIITTNAFPAGTTATGATISPTLTAPAGFVLNTDYTTSNTCSSPSGTGNTRTCAVTVNSTKAGTFELNASSAWSFTGLAGTVNRSTAAGGNAGPGGTDSAFKDFVNANIAISPQEADNAVGTPHTFTITTNAFPAGTTPSLVSITPNLTAPAGFVLNTDYTTSNTCALPSGSGASRSCTFTLTSTKAGTFELNATALWSFTGLAGNVTRSTSGNAGPNGTDSALKHFEDANITIGPEQATNVVGDPHTFTITVKQDDGRAVGAPGGDGNAGLGPPTIGTQVAVTLADDATSHWQLISNSCAGVGNGTDANGQCFFVFTSPTPGTVTGNAKVQILLNGILLVRDTDPATADTSGPGGSGPAHKTFIAGSIRWSKVDNGGRLQAGATFQLCETHKYNIATGLFDDLVPDNCMTVADDTVDDGLTGLPGDKFADDGTIDEDPDGGKFLVSGLELGRYTVHETIAPPGYEPDPDTETVELTPNVDGPPSETDKTIATAFVNSRPILKISGFSYTNEAVDPASQPDGILKGSTTYTVNLHNYGTAAAVLDQSTLVVSGNATCAPSNTKNLIGTLAAENAGTTDDATFTLTCTYDHPDPAAITATLNVQYQNPSNNKLRTASGSPATITFTVAAD